MKIPKVHFAPTQIATAPMADIAFLLIVFFMLTSVFSSHKGIEYTLADGQDQGPPPLIIRIHASGQAQVDGRIYAPNRLDSLVPLLRQRLKQGTSDHAILLTDDRASYGDTVRLIDLLRVHQYDVTLPIGSQRQFFRE